MTSNNRSDSPQPMQALRSLCTEHLQHEATLLAATLLLVRAMEAAFRQCNSRELMATLERHAEVARLSDELERRRAHFRAASAGLLKIAPAAITVPIVLERLPTPDRLALLAELARVRESARELATLNGRVSVFLRVHRDGYRRLLRDLTSSRRGSGRYGPTGSPEAHEYRSLIQIHG